MKLEEKTNKYLPNNWNDFWSLHGHCVPRQAWSRAGYAEAMSTDISPLTLLTNI